jgi:chromosome partitioning protein
VRSASPPAGTTERAGIAEGSPAGEKSGRGAVPGPAQDSETSTVDQSREWPFRDTAPGQDPAGARLDPIWGADPPDSVRWHTGMTADEETATAKTQDQQSPPSQNSPSEPERRTASTAEGGTGQAAPPTEQRASGEEATAPAPQTPHGAGSEVGWFSTEPHAGEPEAGHYSGTLSKRLSAERPGDELPHAPVAGMQPPSRVPDEPDMDASDSGERDPVGSESSTDPRGSSGAGTSSGADGPTDPWGSSGPGRSVGAEEPMGATGPSGTTGPAAGGAAPGVVGSIDAREAREPVGPPEASIRRENAALGTGAPPGRQESPSPESIEAGMVYVDPDPVIGSPPSAAGWAEGPAAELGPHEGSGGRANVAVPEEGELRRPPVRDAIDAQAGGSGDRGAGGTTSTTTPTPSDGREAGAAAPEPEPLTAADAGLSGAARDVSETPAVPGIEAAPSTTTPSTPASSAAGVPEAAAREAVAPEGGALGVGVPGVGAAGAGALGAGTPGAGAPGAAGSSGPDEGSGATQFAEAGEASFDATIDRTPWTEPALPMAWPPGMASPGRGEVSESQDDPADGELVPQPDPTWPRLFGRKPEGEDTGTTGDSSNARPSTTASPQAIGSERIGEEAAEPPGSQREETVHEPAGEAEHRSLAEEPEVSAQTPEQLPVTSGMGLGGDRPVGRPAVPGMEIPHGTPEPSDAVPAGAGLQTASSVPSADSENPATDPPPIVDITTTEPETASGSAERSVLANPLSEPTGLEAGASGAPAPEGGVDAPRHANISTVVRPAEAGEVDLRKTSASPSGDDVSRETLADGGEAMDPGREDEALEDEAAIAVRDAVSRAAAEAGVDVSRETDPMTAGSSIDEPSVEGTIDTESAARNARVTFRIRRDTLNGIRRVLAVANQKGGVGKSTTAVNIGAYLALAGARVLVIDLDPQGNASTGLGLDHREIEPSIYDVLAGDAAPAAAIRATGVPNLHVLPSTIDLAGAEVELVSAMSRETRLRRALQSIDHQYDTILIDCPPSLGLLTVNALAAADELLIPIQCEYYALEGLGQLLRNVELVRANLNPELRIGGIVLTMYDGRTRLALQVVDEVRKHFTDIVYQTVVPRSVRLSEAPGYGLPIALYDPLSRGGIAYRDLTFELAERSGLLAPTGEGAS